MVRHAVNAGAMRGQRCFHCSVRRTGSPARSLATDATDAFSDDRVEAPWGIAEGGAGLGGIIELKATGAVVQGVRHVRLAVAQSGPGAEDHPRQSGQRRREWNVETMQLQGGGGSLCERAK